MEAREHNEKCRVRCLNCSESQIHFLDNYQKDISEIMDSSSSTNSKIKLLRALINSYEDAKWKFIEDFKNDPNPTCPECGSSEVIFEQG